MDTDSASQMQYEKVKQLIDFIIQKGTQFSEIFQYLAGETKRKVEDVYGGNAAETFTSNLKVIADKTEEVLHTLMTEISDEFEFNLEQYQILDQQNANSM